MNSFKPFKSFKPFNPFKTFEDRQQCISKSDHM